MTCPGCIRDVVLETAKHCPECGSPLPIACAACGSESPAGSRFCAECGRPLRQASTAVSASIVVPRGDGPGREATESFSPAAGSPQSDPIIPRAERTALPRTTTSDATSESRRQPGPPPDGTHETPSESAAVDSHRRDDGSISPAWRWRFELIEKAGGPSLPKFGQLSWRGRLQLFSFLGFVFGPFYYLAKGMWRKAITFTAVGLVVGLALELAMTSAGLSETSAYRMSSMVLPVLCATRAYIDYYKKVCLGEEGWI